jgi:hypothetical protein
VAPKPPEKMPQWFVAVVLLSFAGSAVAAFVSSLILIWAS